MDRPLRVVLASTLFPNAAMPGHGIFVENRARHLVRSGAVDLRVVAPVPWVPPPLARTRRYAALAAAPGREMREGVPVEHPRYAVTPRVGMTVTPWSLYQAFRAGIRRLGLGAGDFDLIDAHYFYPDGVAAAWLARQLGKPLVITARGTDINLIPRYALPRRMIQWAAGRADGVVTVCSALKDTLVGLGVPSGKIRVLRNGVDLSLFRPCDRQEVRRRYGLTRPTLLSVGHLVERKGHHLAIEALRELDGFDLLIAGDGEERPRLEAMAASLGFAGRVRFLGALPQASLVELYGAADMLILASSREGWANVLLESMACGTPVVATRAGGTPEVVAAPAAGELAPERTGPALAEAVRRLRARLPERHETRAYAENFSWEETTRGQLDLFSTILGRPAGRQGV